MAKVIETLDGLGKTVISCLNRKYKLKSPIFNFSFQSSTLKALNKMIFDFEIGKQKIET